jgi:hypothetical protein
MSNDSTRTNASAMMIENMAMVAMVMTVILVIHTLQKCILWYRQYMVRLHMKRQYVIGLQSVSWKEKMEIVLSTSTLALTKLFIMGNIPNVISEWKLFWECRELRRKESIVIGDTRYYILCRDWGKGRQMIDAAVIDKDGTISLVTLRVWKNMHNDVFYNTSTHASDQVDKSKLLTYNTDLFKRLTHVRTDYVGDRENIVAIFSDTTECNTIKTLMEAGTFTRLKLALIYLRLVFEVKKYTFTRNPPFSIPLKDINSMVVDGDGAAILDLQDVHITRDEESKPEEILNLPEIVITVMKIFGFLGNISSIDYAFMKEMSIPVHIIELLMWFKDTAKPPTVNEFMFVLELIVPTGGDPEASLSSEQGIEVIRLTIHDLHYGQTESETESETKSSKLWSYLRFWW